jgi:pyruvate kinase
VVFGSSPDRATENGQTLPGGYYRHVVIERQTKIIATMGPAVASQDKVTALVRAGMDVARLNFSHGDHELHRSFATWVRQASADTGRSVALLQDIQGPKIRVGRFPGGAIELTGGESVVMLQGPSEEVGTEIHIDYPYLLDDVGIGESVVLADGLLRIEVTDKQAERLVGVVVQGGELTDHKGAAFPDTNLRVPAVTEKDKVDLEFGRELDVDYVAASFVRSSTDIHQVSDLSGRVPVIAKVELAAAYENLDDLLGAADGVMVARGDLGVELPLERIPFVQQDMLTRTNAAGRISITATEMLESMTASPRPTRAEVTDVANAVAGGTDAVMLSAETAVGSFPIKAVEAMASICREVESQGVQSVAAHRSVDFLTSHRTFASATAKAAVEASWHLGMSTIVGFTESGRTALLLSKYRPAARIMAFSHDPRTRRRMALYWGVTPIEFERRDSTDRMLAAAEKYLEKHEICERGERVVMVAGIPPNQQASTNLMKLHVIGERSRAHSAEQFGDATSL